MIGMLEIIVIIILFSLLVILHEYGHFIAARRGGVDVEEFGIGFPPLLWGKKLGKTLYSFNWLPLGGFVRLKGEDSADSGPGTFSAAPYSVKAKILLAGVGMNLLTAVVILYALCATGLPALGAQFEPAFLTPTYAQPKQLLVVEVVGGSPAAKAGIQQGDFLLKADETLLSDDSSLINFTKAHAGQTVLLHVRTHATQRDVTAKLNDVGSKNGYLGVGTHQVYKLRYGLFQSLVAAVYITAVLFWATIVGVLQLLIHIPVLLMGLGAKTVPAAAQAASGPLGIIFILQSLSILGYAYIFLFMANIAVALAAFNVLPLPALDGGRLALITYQKLTKKLIKPETEAKIHGIGFMALIGLMVLITIYDIRKRFGG
jgi:regulator of sigma E protease